MSLPEHNADTQGCERGKRSRYTPPLPSAAHSGKPLYFVNLHNTKASVIGCTDANVQHQVPHKHSDYLSSGGAIKLSDVNRDRLGRCHAPLWKYGSAPLLSDHLS